MAQEKRVSLPMSLLLQRLSKEAQMFDHMIGGVAAPSTYRHPVIAAMNTFMAPLFARAEAGHRGRSPSLRC